MPSKKTTTKKQWLTSREAAELLGLTKSYINKLCARGILTVNDTLGGRENYISRESVEAYAAEEHKRGPKM